jgi:hypothetical protein
MSDFRYVVEIRVSPARAWSILLDVERWPEWNASVTKVKRMDIGPLTLGSRTRIWQPRLMPAVWQVTSLDEQRRVFAWTTHTLGVRIVARHQIEAVKSLSRVTLSLQYTGVLGSMLARLYRDLNWDYIAREGNGLRTQCEMPATRPQTRIQSSAQSS